MVLRRKYCNWYICLLCVWWEISNKMKGFAWKYCKWYICLLVTLFIIRAKLSLGFWSCLKNITCLFIWVCFASCITIVYIWPVLVALIGYTINNLKTSTVCINISHTILNCEKASAPVIVFFMKPGWWLSDTAI